MRLVFAYDVILEYSRKENLFYHAYFNYSLWKRYLEVFDDVTVISRMSVISSEVKVDSTKLSSGPNVTFMPVPSISSPTKMFTNRPKAKKIILQALFQADALLVRLPSEIGLLAIDVAEKLKKPWAVEVVGHAWDAIWHYGNWKGKVYAPIMTYRIKSVVRRAPFALYVTEKFLQKHYPTNGKTVYCSNVEIPPISDDVLSKRINLINNWKEPYRIGLIGFMGAKYKGIHTALQALNRIKKNVQFEFRLLGGGDPKPWMEMSAKLGIAEKVKFYGTVPAGDPVFHWLDELDLYIQPSFAEGLPRSLIEAMSRGLPALGSTAGGIPELLPENCLFKPGDDKSLSELIINFYQKRDLQIEMAKRNITKAKEYTKSVLDPRRADFLKNFAYFVSKM